MGDPLVDCHDMWAEQFSDVEDDMPNPTTAARYRKKPLVVEARRLTDTELIVTAHGRVRAEAGDWVLTDPATGDTWPIKPDIFEKTYEPAE